MIFHDINNNNLRSLKSLITHISYEKNKKIKWNNNS